MHDAPDYSGSSVLNPACVSFYTEVRKLKEDDLIFFRDRFRAFSRSYYREDQKEQKNILLKEKHSLFVAENALAIAKGEGFGANELMIAETAGLFHDIGRFPQYAKYKTFVDKVSINHGQLGADTLIAERLLSRIPQKEQDIILNAVRFHNAFAVPESLNADAALFTRIVRDSDKLDIWRIFCEYFEGSDEERADATTLGLADGPIWSEEAVTTIMSKQLVNLAHVRTVNDYKLLQLSWVFDLNFKSSFRLVQESGIIGRMAAFLPVSDEISEAVTIAQTYVKNMAI